MSPEEREAAFIRMWKALNKIADAGESDRPGLPSFMTKIQMAEAAHDALPRQKG